MTERTRVQRKKAAEREPAPPIVHDTLAAEGQPLDPDTRAFMEPRFGHEFGHVRVHTDSRAAESAEAVSARAYTVGSNVVFGEGEYAPDTSEGRHLLAHELTHVVQQQTTSPKVPGKNDLKVSSSTEAGEVEADRIASQLPLNLNSRSMRSGSSLLNISSITDPGVIQRKALVRPLRGWGSTLAEDSSNVCFNPHVIMTANVDFLEYRGDAWFNDTADDNFMVRDDLVIPAGATTGTIKFNVGVSWFKDNFMINDTGQGVVHAEVLFTVKPEGTFEFKSRPVQIYSNGTGASISSASIYIEEKALGLVVTFNGIGTSGTTVGVSPGVSGNGGSLSLPMSSTSSSPSGAFLQPQFLINLDLANPQKELG